MWRAAGISAGSGAHAAVRADKDTVLHRHCARDEDDREGRGRARAVQGPGRHFAASDAQPCHQLHRLWHPALPLAAGPWRQLAHGAVPPLYSKSLAYWFASPTRAVPCLGEAPAIRGSCCRSLYSRFLYSCPFIACLRPSKSPAGNRHTLRVL